MVVTFLALLEMIRLKLVRVFQVPADGQAAGETRHPRSVGLEDGRDVHGRRIALEVRVGRDDDFSDAVAFDALREFLHPQILWTDAVERRDRASEDVIAALDQ
jgi:hypothetical protein